jgi:hypothetical protein
MRRVPRGAPAARAVVMADHRASRGGVARPVAARRVERAGKRASLAVRTGENVVDVRRVATPLTGMPFSVSACVLLTWLRSRMMSPCRSATVAAMRAPFALCHGPVPMRSRALIALPSGAVPLRYARQMRPAATFVPDAAARCAQCASAPSNPPRFAPSPLPTLVTKKDIGAGGAAAGC